MPNNCQMSEFEHTINHEDTDRCHDHCDVIASKKTLPGPSDQQPDAEKYANRRQGERCSDCRKSTLILIVHNITWDDIPRD
jgi:hypothetical protein